MSFDLTWAFDDNKYLDPEIYLLVDTLKNNIPSDTIFHIVTNRQKDDKVVKYIMDNIKSKYYFIEKNDYLISRCRYMLNSFKIKTDKEWIVKIEGDFLILKNLSELENILDDNLDLVIEPENRKIFPDDIAARLWRIIYKHLGIQMPNIKIEYRENKEIGLPLFGTGMICIKSNIIPTINKRWVELTKKCEKWINWNIHPNEFAFTAMVFDENWKWKIYPSKYKFNPLGHFKRKPFSHKFLEPPVLPKDIVILDYHRPYILKQVADVNKEVYKIINNCKYLPNDWFDNVDNSLFVENG